jgi:hypothetical protein
MCSLTGSGFVVLVGRSLEQRNERGGINFLEVVRLFSPVGKSSALAVDCLFVLLLLARAEKNNLDDGKDIWRTRERAESFIRVCRLPTVGTSGL